MAVKDLDAVEARLGVPLPAEYRAFMHARIRSWRLVPRMAVFAGPQCMACCSLIDVSVGAVLGGALGHVGPYSDAEFGGVRERRAVGMASHDDLAGLDGG